MIHRFSEIGPKRFVFISLVAASLMFGLSYVWHGLILNDLRNIDYPVWLYLSLLSTVYAVIALMINYLFQVSATSKTRWRGMKIGILSGFFIYLMVFVLGVSFRPDSMEHVLVDFVWQMFEQGAGGGAIAALTRIALRAENMSSARG